MPTAIEDKTTKELLEILESGTHADHAAAWAEIMSRKVPFNDPVVETRGFYRPTKNNL